MERPIVPGILADFDSPDRLTEAASRLRELGYRRLEFHTPYRIDEAATLLDLRRSDLPRRVLVMGLFGAGVALWIQWFANAFDYPLVVGGRPMLSMPAWIPATFEIGVLAAALAAFFGLFAATGLPRLRHPVFTTRDFESASVDGFWLAIAKDDPRFDPAITRSDLESLGPSRIASPDAWA